MLDMVVEGTPLSMELDTAWCISFTSVTKDLGARP